ncbi:MAG: hypothetical protein HY905_18975 [Deltaproteobacteria bacterium]|nr:hypothetical protein [Deltaproteobacteria bacterium]
MPSILTQDETARFYRLLFRLLAYANDRLHLVESLPAEPPPGSVDPNVVAKVRPALWNDPEILEQFIAENPAGLSPADLSTVASWRLRVSGDMVLMRHLKRHSLFLHGDARHHDHVYGVVGLTTPLDELIPSGALPCFVRAVLLPFEGRITYDTQFGSFPVVFGGGARTSMREATRRAIAREGVITTLFDSPRPEPAKRPASVGFRRPRKPTAGAGE